MRSGVDRCDSQKMNQRSKNQEAPMVISPRDVSAPCRDMPLPA
jgi:hypothetical protein